MTKVVILEEPPGVGSDALGRAWFSAATLARAAAAIDRSGLAPVLATDTVAAVIGRILSEMDNVVRKENDHADG